MPILSSVPSARKVRSGVFGYGRSTGAQRRRITKQRGAAVARHRELGAIIVPRTDVREQRIAPSVSADALAAMQEINHPLTAILASAEAAQRWLTGHAPNLAEARDAIEIVIGSCERSIAVLAGVRVKQSP